MIQINVYIIHNLLNSSKLLFLTKQQIFPEIFLKISQIVQL